MNIVTRRVKREAETVSHRETTEANHLRDFVLLDEASGFLLTTKSAGDMGPSGVPAAQRTAFLERSGYEASRVLRVQQRHTRKVIDMSDALSADACCESCREAAPEADGIVFAGESFAAGVTVADCMPILIHRTDYTGAAAILHSGFRGTGIAGEALRMLLIRNGDRSAVDYRAVFGPCISGSCYAIPAERAEKFRRDFGPDTAWHVNGSSYLDMRAANVRLLERSGIGEIVVFEDCTHCTPEFGSYRRDGGDFVRMLAIAGPFRK